MWVRRVPLLLINDLTVLRSYHLLSLPVYPLHILTGFCWYPGAPETYGYLDVKHEHENEGQNEERYQLKDLVDCLLCVQPGRATTGQQHGVSRFVLYNIQGYQLWSDDRYGNSPRDQQDEARAGSGRS